MFQDEKPSEEDALSAQEMQIFDYLKENCDKITSTLREFQAENDLREAFSFQEISDKTGGKFTALDTDKFRSKEDKAKLNTFRCQHWLNFICRIISFHTKKVLSEIRNCEPSKLFLFAPYSLTSSLELATKVVCCLDLLTAMFSDYKEGL